MCFLLERQLYFYLVKPFIFLLMSGHFYLWQKLSQFISEENSWLKKMFWWSIVGPTYKELTTHLYSCCSQKPSDGLHPTPDIEVVKHWLPWHINSFLVSLNGECMKEWVHRSKMYFRVMVNDPTIQKEDFCFKGSIAEVSETSFSKILTHQRPPSWNCTKPRQVVINHILNMDTEKTGSHSGKGSVSLERTLKTTKHL